MKPAVVETQIDIEDPTQLLNYLRTNGHIPKDETPVFRTLAGGVSNKTVLMERNGSAAANKEAWVLKQALEKLRVAVDWHSSPERIHREALGMRWLEKLAPPKTIPAFIFEDQPNHILAMAAIAQPHENWRSMLLQGRISTHHVKQFGFLLGTIHSRSSEQQATVQKLFGDRSFFQSLRLEPYYGYSAQQSPEAAPFLNNLITSTENHCATLVHGDYSPKNILIYEDRLILLDHEVIHWGDPAFDLGFSLTHFLSKAHFVKEKRDTFAQAAMEYWKTYQQTVAGQVWLEGLELRAVRHTLGCLLARAIGRSPLDYMNPVQRNHQHKVVLQLMKKTPSTVTELVSCFIELLNKNYANH